MPFIREEEVGCGRADHHSDDNGNEIHMRLPARFVQDWSNYTMVLNAVNGFVAVVHWNFRSPLMLTENDHGTWF